ncbi:MAG: spore germination protein, partial [Firmicutes bacterium]|nr:spore germination protein [Bacillota bacterium]
MTPEKSKRAAAGKGKGRSTDVPAQPQAGQADVAAGPKPGQPVGPQSDAQAVPPGSGAKQDADADAAPGTAAGQQSGPSAGSEHSSNQAGQEGGDASPVAMLQPPYGSEPPSIQRTGASQMWSVKQAAREAQQPLSMVGDTSQGDPVLCDSTEDSAAPAPGGSAPVSTQTTAASSGLFDYDAGEGGQILPASQQQPQQQQPQQKSANASEPGTTPPVPDAQSASAAPAAPAPDGSVPIAAALTDQLSAPTCDLPVSTVLADNLQRLRAIFSGCSDIVFREFLVFGRIPAFLVYVDGLLDTVELEQQILRPLLDTRQVGSGGNGQRETDQRDMAQASGSTEVGAGRAKAGGTAGSGEGSPQVPAGGSPQDAGAASPALTPIAGGHPEVGQLLTSVLPVAAHQAVDTINQAVHLVLRWQALLFVEGEARATALSVSKWPQRAVEEPDTESVIRGPREGFTENIRTGTALIRRRIHTADLKLESMQLGRYTETQVVLCYIQGLADAAVVAEMRRRLGRIDIDGIIESGYIEELIEDMPFSPFPQIQNTEKPDVVTAMLLEGRVALLIDGTPFALLAPINLWGAMAAPEDYYERFIIATLIRWLRYVFVVMALTLPALYVA